MSSVESLALEALAPILSRPGTAQAESRHDVNRKCAIKVYFSLGRKLSKPENDAHEFQYLKRSEIVLLFSVSKMKSAIFGVGVLLLSISYTVSVTIFTSIVKSAVVINNRRFSPDLARLSPTAPYTSIRTLPAMERRSVRR